MGPLGLESLFGGPGVYGLRGLGVSGLGFMVLGILGFWGLGV